MTGQAVDLGRLADLIRLVETKGLTELVVEENDCSYSIRGTGASRPERAPLRDAGDAATDGAEPRGRREASAEPAGADRTDWVPITAPMVGVFFRSPSPGEPPFVEVGDTVEEGQTLGLIEAMKVFSEVPAEHEGVVAEIAVGDGALVRPDELLLYLAPVPAGSNERDHHE
ncbi:MAG: acetyl-CoA carboxylase, biotin carboxyl carrier protein [Armatimonadetes bacterium]|nr:acetyl-CoA carboxylase, biotin carboxyl carrier protein [Armatimonadota bacterium]